jgi:lysophospholipase L1-like esterase
MSLPARSATAAAWARALRCAWKAATARRGRAATLGSIVVALLALAAPADAAARRIMVFGDSIAWGYVPRAEGPPSTRFPAEQRWPGVMAQALGPGWEVIEEALNGRVTDFTPNPAPVPLAGAGIDGGAYLPAAIASNLPLDLVVIALGTNDTGYKRSALAIGLDAMRLAVAVQDSAGGVATVYPAPAVLLVAPAPLDDKVASGPFGAFFTAQALEVSRALGKIYVALGDAAGIRVLRTADFSQTSRIDGVHLDAAGYAALGRAVADAVREMVPPP